MSSATGNIRRPSAAMRAHEERLGRPLREVFLDPDYREMSSAQLAEVFSVSDRTIRLWLQELGLERRTVIVPSHTENGATSPDARGKPHPGDTADVEVSATGAHPGA